MPVRDGAAFLGEAVESLLGQTMDDLEVVVVDDHSADATPDILRELKARDPRVKPSGNPGHGLVDALNAGLRLAAAPLVARLDADDRARRDRLAAQVDYLDGHPDVVAVGTQIQPFGAEGTSLRPSRYPLAPEKVRRTMARTCCIAHPSVMMRREPVLAQGGYRAPFRHAEDYDLWLRLLDVADLANLDSVGVDYRLHAGMSSIRNTEAQAIEAAVARCLADARRVDRPEPGLGRGPIDRQVLRQLGFDERGIQKLVRKAWFSAARTALRGGDRQASRFCVAQAGPWRLSGGTVGDVADYLWRWLKVFR